MSKCTCGCGHEHHHEHDHSHEREHDHSHHHCDDPHCADHHHEHCTDPNCTEHHHGHDHGGFEVEGGDTAPAVAGIERAFAIDGASPEALVEKWTSVLLEIESWCDERDAFIGHIKLALSADGAAIMLSCTGNGVQRLGGDFVIDAAADSYSANLAAIVYNVEEEALKDYLERAIG